MSITVVIRQPGEEAKQTSSLFSDRVNNHAVGSLGMAKVNIAALTKEMSVCECFTRQQQEEIISLNDSFDQAATHSDAAMGLKLLLSDIIHPQIAQQDEGEQKEKLWEFEERAQNLFENLFPSTEAAANFSAEYDAALQKEKNYLATLVKLQAWFDEAIKKQADAANETTDKIIRIFDLLRKRLLDFNQNKESQNIEINRSLAQLQATLDSSLVSLEIAAKAIKSIGDTISEQERKGAQAVKQLRT